MLLKDLHPDVYLADGWRVVVGVYGGEEGGNDLGSSISLFRFGFRRCQVGHGSMACGVGGNCKDVRALSRP